MPKSSVNASLSSYDDIFSTEESRILTATLSGITSTMQSKKTCPAHHLGI